MCKGCKAGEGGRERARCRRCGECPAEIKPVNVQLAPGFVIQQQQEVASEERCEQQQYELEVKVRKGLADGDELSFARASEQRPGMIPGDVKVKLKVERDDVFRRVGSHLHTTVHISLREALLGFTTTIKHLDGRLVTIERQGVTQYGTVLKVEGEGMPPLEQDDEGTAEGAAGVLHVKVLVDFPDELDEPAQEWARKVLPP